MNWDFDAVDAGGLDESWRQQPGTPVYTEDFDARLTKRGCLDTQPAGSLSALTEALVDQLGFDGVDAGGLEKSWRQQPGTPVYATDLDAEGAQGRARRTLFRQLAVSREMVGRRVQFDEET